MACWEECVSDVASNCQVYVKKLLFIFNCHEIQFRNSERRLLPKTISRTIATELGFTRPGAARETTGEINERSLGRKERKEKRSQHSLEGRAKRSHAGASLEF